MILIQVDHKIQAMYKHVLYNVYFFRHAPIHFWYFFFTLTNLYCNPVNNKNNFVYITSACARVKHTARNRTFLNTLYFNKLVKTIFLLTSLPFL